MTGGHLVPPPSCLSSASPSASFALEENSAFTSKASLSIQICVFLENWSSLFIKIFEELFWKKLYVLMNAYINGMGISLDACPVL